MLASSGAALVASEAFFRWIDGYRWSSLRLIPTSGAGTTIGCGTTPSDPARTASVLFHLDSIALAEGVERSWFLLDPPALSRRGPSEPEMAKRYWAHPGHELEAIYEWNPEYVKDQLKRHGEFCGGLREVFVFPSMAGAPFPRYRFPRGANLPSSLVTNKFGWRGPEIDLNRPPSTIRVAFIGASTTVNPHYFAFSYPEFIGAWLRLWVRSRHPGIDIEVINAGREATNSKDFVAIVRQELLPVDPDLLVYYEGSNQFWPASFVKWPDGRMPVRPRSTFEPPSSIELYSAIARRFGSLSCAIPDGAEPEKPFGSVEWPSSLDESDPDPAHPQLPVNLPDILADIEAIHRSGKEAGADVALCSFVWLVHDGLKLEMPRHQNIYRFLNESFFPFPYSHLRRMADLQNRVFSKFAAMQGLHFIDVDRRFPKDPDLFGDAIHMTEHGTRLHAWIVLQQLVPILEAKIRSGRLPRPPRQPPLETHPALQSSAELVKVDKLR